MFKHERPLAGHLGRSMLLGWLAAVALVAGTGPAQAQVRPAIVRSIDEPARVPYAYSLTLTCPYGNLCYAAFPTVPAGKRVRLTNLQILALGISGGTSPYLGVNRNGNVGGDPFLMIPVPPMNGAFYGTVHSANILVDLIFEAGQTPTLEVGVSSGAGGIPLDPRDRLGVTGYLVDIAP